MTHDAVCDCSVRQEPVAHISLPKCDASPGGRIEADWVCWWGRTKGVDDSGAGNTTSTIEGCTAAAGAGAGAGGDAATYDGKTTGGSRTTLISDGCASCCEVEG